MSTTSPYRRGDLIAIDAGADRELAKVTRCAGTGPYTVEIRRYRWFDRAWDTIRARWQRMLKPYKAWQYSRCDNPLCLRTAKFETVDFDEFCSRHTPRGATPLGTSEAGTL
jgi:hypothetical protein